MNETYLWGGKSACVAFASGCLRSQMSAGLLIDYFQRNGWQVITDMSAADMILVGTCGFQQESEDLSLRLLSLAGHRRKTGAKIVAFGCLAGINNQRLQEEVECLPLICRNFGMLDDLIGARVKMSEVNGPNDLAEYAKKYKSSFTLLDTLVAKFRFSRNYLGECMSFLGMGGEDRSVLSDYERVFNIKISAGCREECSYCAIRFAEGDLASKPMGNILQELRNGLASGYETFNLIGTDVGAYGQDNGTNIAELLTAMVKHDGAFKIVFSDFHPRWLIRHFDALFKVFADQPEKFGFLGFPVQSGSDRVLQRMKRQYKVAEAQHCFSTLRQAVPELQLTTHIMVGFPGEQEEDADQTARFLQTVKFNRVSVYMYSDRPKTLAATMTDKVPPHVARQRFRRLVASLGKVAR